LDAFAVCPVVDYSVNSPVYYHLCYSLADCSLDFEENHYPVAGHPVAGHPVAGYSAEPNYYDSDCLLLVGYFFEDYFLVFAESRPAESRPCFAVGYCFLEQ
jgi:hypothetical protein